MRLILLSPLPFYRKRDLGLDKVICSKSSIKWGEAGFELVQSNSRDHIFNYYVKLKLKKRNKNFVYIMMTVTLFLK